MNKKILLIGGGGHCKSVLDSLMELNSYSEIGIVDKQESVGSSILGFPIVGCDDDLFDLHVKGYNYAFITLGSIGNPVIRIKLYNLLNEIGFIIPTIIDSSAKVSLNAKLEQGVFVGKLSIVNTDAQIKKCAIINSGAIVEHDCQIGAFVHIAPGAVLGGDVFIGENTHIGSNSTIKQQVRIGSNSVIGMGSVVLHNIQDKVIAYGNPCREVNEL